MYKVHFMLIVCYCLKSILLYYSAFVINIIFVISYLNMKMYCNSLFLRGISAFSRLFNIPGWCCSPCSKRESCNAPDFVKYNHNTYINNVYTFQVMCILDTIYASTEDDKRNRNIFDFPDQYRKADCDESLAHICVFVT
jgi:hypothetical protein